jgi:hypothetical protein
MDDGLNALWMKLFVPLLKNQRALLKNQRRDLPVSLQQDIGMASRSLEPFREWEHVLKDADSLALLKDADPDSLSKLATFLEKHGIDPELAQKADQAGRETRQRAESDEESDGCDGAQDCNTTY